MNKIIIVQRIEKLGLHNELRDNLDSRLTFYISKLGYLPIPLPNKIFNFKKTITQLSPNGIILSGGGSPLNKDIRYKNENKLIEFAIANNLPILGICRGAQALNIYNGGKISKIKNHVGTRHKIYGTIVKNKNISVNSYHDYGFDKKLIGKNLNILAYSSDQNIECFVHKKYKMMGIMWHPERYSKQRDFDKYLIKNFFKWI